MAEQAEVLVENTLTSGVNVVRKLSDGTHDLEVVIDAGNQERILLPEPAVSLIITAPSGMDIRDCPVMVKSDVDLAVSHSRTNSNWSMNIVSSELPPEVPATVNVTVGDIRPG